MSLTFKEICKEKGISPSYTRMRIYDYLEDSHTHPTVDEIYQDLSDELPTLSKTTVYNVLNLFIEKHLVSAIFANKNEKRYEINDPNHSHFTCDVCGKIYDIPRVQTTYTDADMKEFTITQEEVNLRGVCKECNNQS